MNLEEPDWQKLEEQTTRKIGKKRLRFPSDYLIDNVAFCDEAKTVNQRYSTSEGGAPECAEKFSTSLASQNMPGWNGGLTILFWYDVTSTSRRENVLGELRTAYAKP